jgi:preprotein translocase subunit SecE
MKIFDLFKETKEEAKKLSFPTRKEVYITGMIILIFSLIVAFSFTVIDFIVSRIIKMILGIGG